MMSHLTFSYNSVLPSTSAQMITGIPASSPNLSVSNPSLSPVCSSEEGRPVSPPLPATASALSARLPVSLHHPDTSRLPVSLASSTGSGPSGGADPSSSPRVGANLDPSQFLPPTTADAAAAAAAAAAAGNLSSLAGYPRLGPSTMMALGAMPGLPYSSATSEQNPYPSLSMENFYNPLANPYSLKEGAAAAAAAGTAADMAAWTSSSALAASAAAGYYPYDTSSLAAYGAYGGAYGLAATRKNVTRESTATLKAWLNEHKKNPYPTKGEKIMLAIISKMTLTQVSCWFANARRRLKKENKMTWEPKNGLNDEDVDVSDEDEQEHSFKEEKSHHTEVEDQRAASSWVVGPGVELTQAGLQDKDGVPLPPSKPRIWSMAELAVSKPSYGVGCG